MSNFAIAVDFDGPLTAITLQITSSQEDAFCVYVLTHYISLYTYYCLKLTFYCVFSAEFWANSSKRINLRVLEAHCGQQLA